MCESPKEEFDKCVAKYLEKKYIVSTMIIRKSYYVIGIVFEKYLFSSVNWR